MTPEAVSVPEITWLRRAIPEFEPVFRERLAAEDGELGAFEAMSAFAEFTRSRLDDTVDDDVLRRAFAAVERLIIDQTFGLGDALAAEFVEAIHGHPGSAQHMGPATRSRAGLA